MALPIKIEHRIGIQTPAAPVWELISDINRWSAWNPLYPKASGVIQFGERLDLEVALPGQKPRAIRPVIQDWTPGDQIIWSLSLLGGLLRSTRYLEIETLDNGNCIFSNGEIFEGPLLGLIGRKQRRAIKAGFTALGETVRDRVEAAWKAEHPDATSAA
ncbi:MAG TPA: SRPBCC domain-containing protein [Caulobacteraceae bacterium]|jgi:hypothetical protein